jgi:hypothetical protein
MPTREKVVRQSVTLPVSLAKEVQNMAKRQHLSASRMLVTLVDQGVQARKQQRKALFDLIDRFRASEDPEEVARLGDQLGRMVFGE